MNVFEKEETLQTCCTKLRVVTIASFFLALLGTRLVHSLEDDAFTQRAKLLANDKAAQDQFGAGVALSGGTALIGAPGDDDRGNASGSVYVLTQDEQGQWREVKKLTASDGGAGDFFGTSVALSGDIALIGARGHSSQGSFAGAAYVFVRDATGQWSEQQKLAASDGIAGSFFGWSVALNGNIALIGARGEESSSFPGAAYVFTQNEQGQWSGQQKLTASDGIAGSFFGWSVALNGNIALIGAPGADEKGSFSGAAYVFMRDDQGQWSERQKLTASDGTAGDEFGSSVTMRDDIVLVGGRFGQSLDEDGGVIRPGAVYVFLSTGGHISVGWIEVQKLTPSDGKTGDEFGASVALGSATALIGAPRDDERGGLSGAAYLFVHDPDDVRQWSELQKLMAADAVGGDEFGSSAALDGERAIVGVPLDNDFDKEDEEDGDANDDDEDDPISDSGAVYIFEPAPIPSSCEIRTAYGDATCSGTFAVSSLAELDEYITSDFGRKDNDGKHMNLDIRGSLDSRLLTIESPCQITFHNYPTLSGDFVKVDGRKGVVGNNGYAIEADRACVLSEQEKAELGPVSAVNVGELTIQAAKTARIGKNATVTVEGTMAVVSTGSSDSSKAIVDTGAFVFAGTLQMEAVREASLGEKTTVTVDGPFTVTSSTHNASVRSGAKVEAISATISAPREAKVGKNTAITLSGDLAITATGDTAESHAVVDAGTTVTVAGNMALTSGNKATLAKNATVTVTEDLHMEAVKCTVSGSATVIAGSTSGNCL